MSKDFINMNNDLSWLANSSFPSSNSISSFPKIFDLFPQNHFEPWEFITNIDQVCRNLNKNLKSKNDNIAKKNFSECNNIKSIPLNLSENNTAFSFLNKSSHEEPSLAKNETPQKWNCFEMPIQNNDKEIRSNTESNLSHFLNFDENKKQSDNQFSNAVNSLPMNFKHLSPEFLDFKMNEYNSCALNDSFHNEKTNVNLNGPCTLMDSLLSPTSTPPLKLNTDLIALMQELALITNENEEFELQQQNILSTPFQSPPLTPSSTPTKGCVFCKNCCYHSTFYKSHELKDGNGHCMCPVLRTYTCPLCGGTGDFAHTIKYCPRNTVTKGDPIAAGLPPGKVTNWREVATKMSSQRKPMS